MNMIPILAQDRPCDGCKKCCEGHLTGVAYGYEFYPGKKCNFIRETGCGIYDVRPYNPCKTFKCGWKYDLSIPEWMKPDKINLIFVARHENGFEYYNLIESGGSVNVEILSWAIQTVQDKKVKNIRYFMNGKWISISNDPEFIKYFNER
jgi:uncharacterized cysteine cluster protein YcgN (CxxCxxCC family)